MRLIYADAFDVVGTVIPNDVFYKGQKPEGSKAESEERND